MNLTSYVTGWVVRWELPKALQRHLNRLFVWAFGIDLSEAKVHRDDYPSLEAVFIRALHPGCRPIAGDYVSPADGKVTQSGPLIGDQQLLQAKGISCSALAMIYGEQVVLSHPPPLNLAWSTTVYLAPHNYHRVHSPVTGRLRWVNYIPGELWPVNATYTRVVPRLWSRNERLVFGIALDRGWAYVVMIGAFNVGRMASPFLPGFTANSAARVSRTVEPFHHIPTAVPELDCGAELGVFMLGSTVVTLLDQAAVDALRPSPISAHQAIKYGESLVTQAN